MVSKGDFWEKEVWVIKGANLSCFPHLRKSETSARKKSGHITVDGVRMDVRFDNKDEVDACIKRRSEEDMRDSALRKEERIKEVSKFHMKMRRTSILMGLSTFCALAACASFKAMLMPEWRHGSAVWASISFFAIFTIPIFCHLARWVRSCWRDNTDD